MKLVTFTATLLLVFCMCHDGVRCYFRETLARRSENLSGFIYYQQLLWSSEVRSPIECHRNCASHEECAGFTFTLTPGQETRWGLCRGHRNTSDEGQIKTADAQTAAYLITSRITSAPPDLLYSSCEVHTDCAGDDASWKCLEFQCTCAPGLFYRVSEKDCVLNCSSSNLVDDYLEYSGHELKNTTVVPVKQSWTLSEQECWQQCLDTTWCRAVNFHISTNLCAGFEAPPLRLFLTDFITGAGSIFKMRMCL